MCAEACEATSWLGESFGRQLVDAEVEGVAVRAEPLEVRSEASLHGDALRSARGDDSEEDANLREHAGAAGYQNFHHGFVAPSDGT